ncbi:MAG: helix-turn-helix domain-containing protein [Caulobacteraceae bacterium]|nr:helix-turn-helix domain-containing protein [Caulobacteraceae bacterium]
MERRGNLAAIGEIIERNIFLKGADALTQKGFTMVPNHVLVSGKISPGAKLCFAMLLRYAWQNGFCFPGQTRLALDMGVSDRSVRTFCRTERAGIDYYQAARAWKAQSLRDQSDAFWCRPENFPVRTGRNLRSRPAIISD